MARKVDRLTDRTIKALKIKTGKKTKKPTGYYCADGDGLYLQVSPSGSKSWVFRYKLNGKAREMGLGGYPSTTLAEARKKAQEARQHRADDTDPIAAREAQAAEKRLAAAGRTTFKDCAEQLIAANENGWKNAKHRQQWRNSLAADVYPLIGDLPVADITTDLVLKVLEPIWQTKTETASRLRGRIERVLASAKVRGLRVGENPAQWRGHLDQILPARSKIAPTKHHPALTYRELPVFMARLRAKEGVAALALEFTILTAARAGESTGATFDEFDLTAKVWSIPGPRMKGGRSHRVPLCNRALAIVKELATTRLNQFVFPGVRRGTSLAMTTMLVFLRELHRTITVHGFRSTFKDWASEVTSFPDHISEAALAHASADKVRAAYARSDLFEKRRELMDAWAMFCTPAQQKGAARRGKNKSSRGVSVTAA